MRIVGEGHAFHPQTGLCHRCGCDVQGDVALVRCEKAPNQPAPSSPKSPSLPDLFELSKKQ